MRLIVPRSQAWVSDDEVRIELDNRDLKIMYDTFYKEQEPEYMFKLTWEECQDIIDMFDAHPSEISTKLSKQLLQYAVTE